MISVSNTGCRVALLPFGKYCAAVWALAAKRFPPLERSRVILASWYKDNESGRVVKRELGTNDHGFDPFKLQTREMHRRPIRLPGAWSMKLAKEARHQDE